MTSTLLQGLLISVIGMGLVVGALALLWGVMALLMRLSQPRSTESPRPVEAEDHAAAAPSEGPPDSEVIAAIAAALALLRAEQEAEAAIPWRLPPVLTRWVAVGYSRQLRHWSATRRDV